VRLQSRSFAPRCSGPRWNRFGLPDGVRVNGTSLTIPAHVYR